MAVTAHRVFRPENAGNIQAAINRTVVGDFLDKPIAAGGLALSRFSATAALLAFMTACIMLFPLKAARKVH